VELVRVDGAGKAQEDSPEGWIPAGGKLGMVPDWCACGALLEHRRVGPPHDWAHALAMHHTTPHRGDKAMSQNAHTCAKNVVHARIGREAYEALETFAGHRGCSLTQALRDLLLRDDNCPCASVTTTPGRLG